MYVEIDPEVVLGAIPDDRDNTMRIAILHVRSSGQKVLSLSKRAIPPTEFWLAEVNPNDLIQAEMIYIDKATAAGLIRDEGRKAKQAGQQFWLLTVNLERLPHGPLCDQCSAILLIGSEDSARQFDNLMSAVINNNALETVSVAAEFKILAAPKPRTH